MGRIVLKILLTSWCCFWLGWSLEAQTGPQGIRLYQLENADTANTGDSRATYEGYFVMTKLDTIGIDDYRLYYEDTLLTIIYGSGDSVVTLGVQDTVYITYPEPSAGGSDTTYAWIVTVDGGSPDTITNLELINFVSGSGIDITHGATNITIASTVTDTDTYIDSVRQITAGALDSIWLYRNDLSDSLLIVLDDSVGAGSDTYIDSIRHVTNGVLDSVWFYRSDMSDSLLLVLNDSVSAGGGGSDTYIDSVRQVVVGSLDSIWLYRNDLSDSLLIVLNDSVTVLPKSRFVFTDPSTGELTTNATWADSILLYNGSQRYGLMDDDNNVSFGRLVGAGGSNNLKLGGSAGYRNTGDHNTYLGFESGYLSLTASHLRNVGIGSGSGIDASGDDNIYLGSQSGRYNVSDFSTYIGTESGYMTVVPSGSSDNNLAMGYQSARDAEGDNNVYLGNQAGLSTEGSNNIFIGSISTLTGSVSNRLAIGGPSDYFIDGNMSTDSLTVNSTLTVRDVPASSAPDSVYVLGPGHELNSYPISSISGIDTYIDSAAYDNVIDTLTLYRDSSGTVIDSFKVLIETDTFRLDYDSTTALLSYSGQLDSPLVVLPWKDAGADDYSANFFKDSIRHDGYVGIWTVPEAPLHVVDPAYPTPGADTFEVLVALFEQGGGGSSEIALENGSDVRWRLISHSASPFFISHADEGVPKFQIDTGAQQLALWIKPDDEGIQMQDYGQGILQDTFSYIAGWRSDGDLVEITLDQLLDSLNQDSTVHRDFDFILLPLNDTLGTNIDSLNPDDSTDLYALIWHGGQVRIGETPYQIRYDTLQPGVDATASIQVMQRTDAIDTYQDTVVTWWLRNNKGDAQIRFSDNEMTHDTTPSFLEFGFINWQDTSKANPTTPDTILHHPMRISSHANNGALEVYQDSILLGDYVEGDTTITTSDLLGSGIYLTSPNGKLRAITPDTLNAYLSVVASAPQEIDTFALNNDSLVLDLTNTTGGLKYVDFSNYNNSNITISNDSLFVGDSVLILPQGADSSGVVIPTGEIYFGQNTRAPDSSPSLSFDGSTTLTLDQGGEGSAYFEFIDNNSVIATFNKVSSGASYGIMDFSVSPSNGSDDAIIRFNRNSGTSGASYVDVHYGDGSAATGARIGGDNTDSWIARYGNLAVGHNSPSAQLHVDGTVRLDNLAAESVSRILYTDADNDVGEITLNDLENSFSFDDTNIYNTSGSITGSNRVLTMGGFSLSFENGGGTGDQMLINTAGNVFFRNKTNTNEYIYVQPESIAKSVQGVGTVWTIDGAAGATDAFDLNSGNGVFISTIPSASDSWVLTYNTSTEQMTRVATSTFLTGNQTITLSGDVTGSGSTSITTNIAASAVGSSEINNNSIAEVDLSITNGGIDGYILSYNSSGGNFTWLDPSSLGGGGSDGDGIYDGSGTIGVDAVATTSGDGFTINVTGGDYFYVDYGGSSVDFGVNQFNSFIRGQATTPVRIGSEDFISDELEIYSRTGYVWMGHEDFSETSNGIYFHDSPGEIEINGDTYIGDDADDQLEIITTTSWVDLQHEDLTANSYLRFNGNGEIRLYATSDNDDDVLIEANDFIRLYARDLTGSGNSDVEIQASKIELDGTQVTVNQIPAGAGYEFDVNGDINYSGSLTNVSDSIIKRDITYLSDPYEKVLALKPAMFHYKDIDQTSALNKDVWHFNYIAQDYETVFPDQVKEARGIKAIQKGAAEMYTVAAVQQLIKEVQQLKSEIETVKSRK